WSHINTQEPTDASIRKEESTVRRKTPLLSRAPRRTCQLILVSLMTASLGSTPVEAKAVNLGALRGQLAGAKALNANLTRAVRLEGAVDRQLGAANVKAAKLAGETAVANAESRQLRRTLRGEGLIGGPPHGGWHGG